MDSFVVSARKYRPQKFNAVVGQSHITSTLRNAIQNRQLAQAYLFCGPRGVGKTTCARIFAKTINCFNVTADGEACDQCDSCMSFNSGASLNVYELDAASNNSVDDIRALVDQVRVAPQLGEYKVYVIDEVHMLSTAAFNAFLKTLEEPPKHAKFILATTEKHKIIPTILSRCQVFNFNRIRAEDIGGYLAYLAKEEKIEYEQEALNVIAQKADGGLRDACSIFDQMVAFTRKNLTYKEVVENLHVLDYDYYFRLTDLFLKQSLPEVMLILDEILRKGFDAHNFITGLGEHLRNILVSRDPQTVTLLEVSESLRQRYLKQAEECPVNFLMRALSAISKADVNFRSARNQRLLVEMTLMQLTYLTAPADAEKKNNDGGPGVIAAPEPAVPAAVKQAVIQEPEPQFARKPSVSFEHLKIKTSFSLSNALSTPAQPQAVAVQEVLVETAATNRDITIGEVVPVLHHYADEKLRTGARQLATTLKNAELFIDGCTVKVTVQNESQREILQSIRHEVLDHLRKALMNNSIGLDLHVTEVSTQAKAWKPADIFREMAARNPALLELKKRFDLEIDY
jgi:DNA polymerase III subunit gamma/tau